MYKGYGRIALILVKLHLGREKVMVELNLGSTKVFQQNYNAFEGVKRLKTLIFFPTYSCLGLTIIDNNHWRSYKLFLYMYHYLKYVSIL